MEGRPMAIAPHDSTSRSGGLLATTIGLGIFATALIPINFFVWLERSGGVAFYALALLQLVTGFAAAIVAMFDAVRTNRGTWGRVGVIFWALFASLVGLGGPVALLVDWLLGSSGGFLLGGAWGRPLRVRGRQVHPELRDGADWTRGGVPSTAGLDAPTRRALEALWLHDAQKEHASVPAFSRIAWMLAAVGAPADLMEGAHRAALEEIDHARRCFALAAGYGGRSHTVEPMPELLLGLELDGDARVTLAVESLRDGCLLEDFNADVAARCAEACREPVTRDVLGRIAREERSHACFSWDVLAFALERWPSAIRPALERELGRLDDVARPTAVSSDKAPLVAAADAPKMRAHGRITDAEWAILWRDRLRATRERVEAALGATKPPCPVREVDASAP